MLSSELKLVISGFSFNLIAIGVRTWTCWFNLYANEGGNIVELFKINCRSYWLLTDAALIGLIYAWLLHKKPGFSRLLLVSSISSLIGSLLLVIIAFFKLLKSDADATKKARFLFEMLMLMVIFLSEEIVLFCICVTIGNDQHLEISLGCASALFNIINSVVGIGVTNMTQTVTLKSFISPFAQLITSSIWFAYGLKKHTTFIEIINGVGIASQLIASCLLYNKCSPDTNPKKWIDKYILRAATMKTNKCVEKVLNYIKSTKLWPRGEGRRMEHLTLLPRENMKRWEEVRRGKMKCFKDQLMDFFLPNHSGAPIKSEEAINAISLIE